MSDAINAARSALHLVWPNGRDCEHVHARTAFHALDAAEKREVELVEALEAMCYQYLRVDNGKLHHDFMSAGEAAFDALGWPDTGQPMEKECLCEVEGCGQGWSAGANGKDGKYHTFCSKHYREWLDAGNNETPEQADARWVADMVDSGLSEEQAQDELAYRRKQQAEWAALREKMPEPEPIATETAKTLTAAEKVQNLARVVSEQALAEPMPATTEVTVCPPRMTAIEVLQIIADDDCVSDAPWMGHVVAILENSPVEGES